MSNIDKLILKMKRQPNGIRFQELSKVLEFYGYKMKDKKRTSHRHFFDKDGNEVTIKEDNPLKAVYVKDVLKRIKV